MKRIAAVLACLVLAAAVFGSSTSAQEPPLDLGETNLLLMACDYGKTLAESEGLSVKNCRRHAPEQVDGFKAVVPTRLVTNEFGAFILTVHLNKSLWRPSNVDVEYVG